MESLWEPVSILLSACTVMVFGTVACEHGQNLKTMAAV